MSKFSSYVSSLKNLSAQFPKEVVDVLAGILSGDDKLSFKYILLRDSDGDDVSEVVYPFKIGKWKCSSQTELIATLTQNMGAGFVIKMIKPNKMIVLYNEKIHSQEVIDSIPNFVVIT